MPVCICGMHRSGTSMISNTLSRCGIYLGPEDVLKRAGADNEQGFWENDAFVKLNDDLLRQMFGGWDTPPVRFAGWEDEPQLEPLRDRARRLIEEHHDKPIWGWKDPRSSLTLPFWKQLMPDLKVVICLRNPLEVAQSLSRRNYLSIPFGLKLWYIYQAWAVAASDPAARMITHYDVHFTKPRAETERLLAFLSCQVSDEVLDQVSQTCNARLRHNHARMDLLQAGVPTDVATLYYDLCAQAGPVWQQHFGDEYARPFGTGDDAAAGEPRTCTWSSPTDAMAIAAEQAISVRYIVKECLRNGDALRGEEVRRLAGEVAAHRNESDRLRITVAAQESEIQRLTDGIVQRDQDILRLNGVTSSHETRIETLNNAIAASDQEVSRLAAELQTRDRTIGQLTSAIADRDQEVSRLAAELEARDRTIGQLTSAIADRDDSIIRLSAEVASLDDQKQQLAEEAVIREREFREHAQETSLRSLAQLRQLQGEIASLYRRVQDGQGRIRQLKTLTTEMQEHQQAILASVSWRVTRPMRVLRRGARSAVRAARLLACMCYWFVTGQYRRHWQQRKTQNILRASGLFDPAWYRKQNPDLPTSIDPLAHFVAFGAAEKRNPCPLFDTAWYVRQCDEVAKAGANPLLHYLCHGAAEGRKPHPLFDSDWYVQQNPDVAAAGVNPLKHFLQAGSREGRSPHPLFDSAWYLQQNPDVAATDLNPLEHFLAAGAAEGRNPSPRFDTLWYLRQNPDVARTGVNPLIHYVEIGAHEGRQPLPPAESTVAASERIVFPTIEAPAVSIVVSAHGDWEHTRNCLCAILANSGDVPYEVILADDGSTDETRREYGNVVGLLVAKPEPDGTSVGAVRSRNRAAAGARGKYLVFLDNDTLVQPGWLQSLLDTAEHDETVGVVGVKLLYGNGQLQEAGGIIWNDATTTRYGTNEDPGKPEYNYLRETDYVSATAMLVRTAVWNAVGGFDNRFAPAGYEDADMALQCRKEGYKVLYQPHATVVHLDLDHASADSWNLERLQALNRRAFRQKWSAVLQEQHLPPNTDLFLAHDHSRHLKHLLYCDWELPAEDRDSGSFRACNLMRILISLGYRVSFLPANLHPGQPRLDRLQQMGIFTMCGPGLSSREDIIKRYGGYFDVVIVSRVNVAEVCMELVRKHCPQAFVLFDTTDLHFLREQREAELRNDDALRAQSLVTKKKELAFMDQADVTLVVSPFEVGLLRQEAPKARVRIVSNIHPVYGSTASFAERKNLLFIGGFVHHPNVDAVKWLAQDIFPHIRRQLPGVRLYVLGSYPPPEIQELECPDFRIVGYVPDVAPYFKDCRLSVVPLRFGAGVKGKINLSMSYGLPVVATSMGCEGMFLTHGQNVLIADDPREFANAVCQAYSDETLWNRLSAEGLENVREHFSFAAARKALQSILPGAQAPAEPIWTGLTVSPANSGGIHTEAVFDAVQETCRDAGLASHRRRAG